MDFKKASVISFIGIIFTGFLSFILIKDKEVSYIENKVLQQMPKISTETIFNGSFMSDFDVYAEDQFPLRTEFINIKNITNYVLGQREFRNVYLTKDKRLLEKFNMNKENLITNMEDINSLSEKFNLDSTIIAIPNSIDFYKESLPKFAITDSQIDALDLIKDTSKIDYYTPYNVLKDNKDKYIYFNTDHHWTQLGAKLAYEDLFDKKVDYKYEKVADDFNGTYYSKVMLKGINGDSIYAYNDLANYKIEYDGNTSNKIYDKNKLETKNKYQYFLNGDPAMSVIYGEGEGEIVILKDSFAHNFIPFLAKDYSKIHVIDPRYCNFDVKDYVDSNPNISQVFYIFSVSSLNDDKLFKKIKAS